MENFYDRTANLIGLENILKLADKNVMVLGIGGVGGFVCEALSRVGIGHFVLVDNDVVSITNINRQIIALHSSVGRNKTEVMKERILDINPNAKVECLNVFITKENASEFDFNVDFVVDAIDNVTAKIELAKLSESVGFNLISCMGTGNKLEPERFEICDISKTSVCPLAKVMRKRLKEEGVKKLTVLYSKEEPKNVGENGRLPASISFTPSIAGLRIAEYVIKQLIGE